MKRALVGIITAVLIVGGVSLYVLMAPGGIPGGGVAVVTNPLSSASNAQSSNLGIGSPAGPTYDCASPAIQTQFSCDVLPAGYQIPARLPNAPAPYCSDGMTSSACSLLKKTWANGVCDPNETVWTDPLDCGCSGALTGDPYTGRCNAPASICQIAVRVNNQQAG